MSQNLKYRLKYDQLRENIPGNRQNPENPSDATAKTFYEKALLYAPSALHGLMEDVNSIATLTLCRAN